MELTPPQQPCSAGCDCSGKQDTARRRLDKVLLCWISVFLILLHRTHFPVNFTFFFTSSIINVLNPVTLKRLMRKNETLLYHIGKYRRKKKKQQVRFSQSQEYISTRIYLSFMLKIVWGASPSVEQSPMPTARCHPCVGTRREVPHAKNWPPATQCGMNLMSSRRTESQPQLHPSL